MEQTTAMDALVEGKTDSELLNIMVYALTSNENILLNKLTDSGGYTSNKPDAAIIAAICRHVRHRVEAKNPDEAVS